MTENRTICDVTYERTSLDITEFDYDIGNASPKIMVACSYFTLEGGRNDRPGEVGWRCSAK